MAGCCGRGRLFVRGRGLAQRDTRDRLAAQRIVVEQGDAEEGDQKQAEQHRERLHGRERQPVPALLTRRLLSERRAQFVGRLCHGSPRINCATIPRCGRFRRGPAVVKAQVRLADARSHKQKGRPEGRPFRNLAADQFAALLAGLSIAALSPPAGAGAVDAVDLMPCRRSAAIFSALSSLASGGTYDCEPVFSSPSDFRWPRSEASPLVSVRAFNSSGTSCSTSISGTMPLAWIDLPDGV